eukprot:c11413_g2_i1.p1 GENE.c11413_g2_i1~~c11413_g2_i1.p1  ORF type:complete len:113 (-),score=11.44 c11413_g2_i1:92-430(-)
MGVPHKSEQRRNMSEVLYCGNLAFATTQDELRSHCELAGAAKGLNEVEMILRNGRSRGWALLHYASDVDAAAAQAKLHNTVLAERSLNVRENRESSGFTTHTYIQRPTTQNI